MTGAPIKVLIVDDSAVVRQVLSAVLSGDPAIQVLGTASDPLFAMERMNREWPDVVILDVEMPRMDGITFLKKIMSIRPTAVVICSTLTEKGAETTLQAMSAGAVCFVTKPRNGLKHFLEEDAGEIISAVKTAASGDMRRVKALTQSLRATPARASAAVTAPVRAAPVHRSPVHTPAVRTAPTRPMAGSATGSTHALAATTERLVAIGTSTGGTQALQLVLTALPRVIPGIVIVQHMPEKFTAAFAARLDGMCEAEVLEARDGDRVLPGRVLIAPGGWHMSVVREGAQYRVRVSDGPAVNRHKPSVDVLFRSVAEQAGRNALGIIMTGMGDDGARGLLQMHEAGAYTIAQNKATCVIYGMPQQAVSLGGVDVEMPLQAISGVIERYQAQR